MSQLTPEEKARIVEEEQLRHAAREQAKAKDSASGCLWGCGGLLSFAAGGSALMWIFTKPAKFWPWLLGAFFIALMTGGGFKWSSREWWKYALVTLVLAGLGFWFIAGGERA